MENAIRAGYLYELLGIVLYGGFLVISRPRAARRFSRRTRALTLAAAFVLAASVPLRYASVPAVMVLALLLALAALLSALADRRASGS